MRPLIIRTKHRRRRRSGFTLVELIVAMTVGVLISGSAGWLLWNATNLRTRVAARSEIADAAATALETIVRHVREIPQDECPANPTPCLLGNAQVTTATATELRFGSTGVRLSGTQIELTTDNAANWYPLGKDVSEFAFAYYNRSGTALAGFPLSQSDREDIRRVQVTVAMTRGSESVKLRTGIYLRSFMDEVTTNP